MIKGLSIPFTFAESIKSEQPKVADVLHKKSGWTPLKRHNRVFNLSDQSQSKSCHIAIPLKNSSDYGPFINLRVTNPENKKAAIPYLAWKDDSRYILFYCHIE